MPLARQAAGSKHIRKMSLLRLLLDAEDGGTAFLQRDTKLLPDYTTSHPRTHQAYFSVAVS